MSLSIYITLREGSRRGLGRVAGQSSGRVLSKVGMVESGNGSWLGWGDRGEGLNRRLVGGRARGPAHTLFSLLSLLTYIIRVSPWKVVCKIYHCLVFCFKAKYFNSRLIENYAT